MGCLSTPWSSLVSAFICLSRGQSLSSKIISLNREAEEQAGSARGCRGLFPCQHITSPSQPACFSLVFTARLSAEHRAMGRGGPGVHSRCPQGAQGSGGRSSAQPFDPPADSAEDWHAPRGRGNHFTGACESGQSRRPNFSSVLNNHVNSLSPICKSYKEPSRKHHEKQ